MHRTIIASTFLRYRSPEVVAAVRRDFVPVVPSDVPLLDPPFIQAGVERFVFVSAAGAQHEHMLMRGYWKGKQKAEAAILERCVPFS